MKTVKDVYGVTCQSIMYADGSFLPSRVGEIFPEDFLWRWDAALEYKNFYFKTVRTIRELIVNELCVENYSATVMAVIEFDRLYPKYLGEGMVEITEFRAGRVKKTAIKLSKLLTRVAPLAKSHRIRHVCDLLLLTETPCTIEYTREPSKVLHAYAGVRSCMTGTELPIIYLQDKEISLAIIKARQQIVGRFWIHNGVRSRIYSLSTFEGSCKRAASGLEEDKNFLEGVRFYSPNRIFPFLDSCNGRVDFDGEYITPNPYGEYKTSDEGRIEFIE